LQASGIDPEQGVLRLSFVHYTSQAEVDKLMTVLEDIL
jgi:selenocysteine lyase/cysteine desulfurase